MSDYRKGNERVKNLRRNAEDMVKKFAPSPNAEANVILMHELTVHRVEIEMQNEELQITQNLITESRDRYVDLYEFSPVAYITLSRDGLISEVNLTGCQMLGVERFRLMSRRLSSYIASHDRDRWYCMFMNLMAHEEIHKQTFAIKMMRTDGSFFNALLCCIKKEKSESSTQLHIAVTDISELIQEPNDVLSKVLAPAQSGK